VSPDVFSAEALLMELNEPSGSGSGSHAEPSRLGAPVAHAPPDAARLPGAGRVEELEEDVQAVSTGQEIELRLQMDGGGRGKGRGVAAAAAAAADLSLQLPRWSP
jgi:hypothetical protein